MANEEFDVQLSELEVRLERLRSLYEQYFVGIEKMEPAVARKDVDRRFWELRKVKVRNTAKRFKFQTLIQRYNTLQQYWMKVCRQIENGTYVRHLARAKRRIEQASAVPALTETLDEQALGADDPSIDEVRAAFNDLERSTQPPGAFARSLSQRPPRRSQRPSEPVSSSALTPLSDHSGLVPPPRRPRAAPPLPNKRASAEVTQVASPKASRSLPPRATGTSKSIAPRSQTDRSAHAERTSPSDRPHAAHAERTKVATPPRTAVDGAKPARPAAAAGPTSLSEARIDRLYAELERARHNTGDQPISRSALAKSLRQMEQRLKQKHEGKDVDFRVEIQDGEARIKPVVKRGGST